MTVATELWTRRGAITGGRTGPGRTGHARSRRPFDEARSAAVVRCTRVEQVVAGLGVARRSGLRVRVGCGGHRGGGVPSSGAGVLVIDLCRMRDVAVDARARRARAGAGAPFAAVDAAAEAHDLGDPRLVGAEVVTADGLVRQVGPGRDPDLFGALCRGGVGLGVVTRVDLALRPCRGPRRSDPLLDVLTGVVGRRDVAGPDRERREMIRRAYDPEGLFATD